MTRCDGAPYYYYWGGSNTQVFGEFLTGFLMFTWNVWITLPSIVSLSSLPYPTSFLSRPVESLSPCMTPKQCQYQTQSNHYRHHLNHLPDSSIYTVQPFYRHHLPSWLHSPTVIDTIWDKGCGGFEWLDKLLSHTVGQWEREQSSLSLWRRISESARLLLQLWFPCIFGESMREGVLWVRK